jgi:hypothetical protein
MNRERTLYPRFGQPVGVGTAGTRESRGPFHHVVFLPLTLRCETLHL